MNNLRKYRAPPHEDRISMLPNDVVVMILSRLTMKEAVRTSILSSSWKDTWKAYAGFLDFDAPNLICLTSDHPYLSYIQHLATCKYAVWVDKLLDYHQMCQTCIKGLRIVFDMNMEYSFSIDRWIDFAIRKKVESLVLDLSPLGHSTRYADADYYAFPSWLLYAPLGGSHAFDRLTSLELRFVRVAEQVTDYIVANCHLLQRLSLEQIPDMKSFRLDNSLPELRHLEITICSGLQIVYVSARRLTSFKYVSDLADQTNMIFGDVPQLSMLVLGGKHYNVVLDNLPFNLSQLDSVCLMHKAPVCLDQDVSAVAQDISDIAFGRRPKEADNMVLNTEGCVSGNGTICYGTLGKFQELKQLELNIAGCVGDRILCSSTFLHASTCLEKLVLTLTWRYPRGARPRNMAHVLRGCKHKSLKEVVYVGWLGLDAEVEIVELLIESAMSLERITINLCYSHNNDKNANIKLKTRWEKDNAKARAMQLQQKLVSSNAKLLVN